MPEIAKAIENVFGMYRRYGAKDYIGEPVSQNEHMIQCAMLAESEGWEPQYVLAALFHDIGHLVAFDKDNVKQMMASHEGDESSRLGAMEHGKLGGDYLRQQGFPAIVCDAVEAHVDAKRYLVFADPEYHDKLSPASKQTLIIQGGPMKASEAEAFKKKDYFDAVIRLRHWDDLAKVEDMELKPLEHYEEICRKYLSSQ